jgi:hypothetical protein
MSVYDCGQEIPIFLARHILFARLPPLPSMSLPKGKVEDTSHVLTQRLLLGDP